MVSTTGSRTLGPVLSEALLLALTIGISVVGVALLIFLPYAFLGDQASLRSYLDVVSSYLVGLARGDLGSTASQRPAGSLLLGAAWRSLELLAVSLGAGLLLGLIWGGLLATLRRGWLRLALFGVSTLLLALPTFALLLLSMEAFSTLTLRTGMRLTSVYGYGLDDHLARGLRQCNFLWLFLEPLLAFTLAIMGFNLLAEGLRRRR